MAWINANRTDEVEQIEYGPVSLKIPMAPNTIVCGVNRHSTVTLSLLLGRPSTAILTQVTYVWEIVLDYVYPKMECWSSL